MATQCRRTMRKYPPRATKIKSTTTKVKLNVWYRVVKRRARNRGEQQANGNNNMDTSGPRESELEQALRKMKEGRDEMIARSTQREAEKEAEFKTFQQQVKNETTNLLKHVSEIQTLIATNEEAHVKSNERIEVMFKARDEKAEAVAAAANAKAEAAAAATNAKFDQIMATILAQSSQVKCPADDFDTEAADDVQPRGREQKSSGAHSVDARTRSNSRENNAEATGKCGENKF